MIHPQADRHSQIEDWRELPDFIGVIRQDAMRELLIVVSDETACATTRWLDLT